MCTLRHTRSHLRGGAGARGRGGTPLPREHGTCRPIRAAQVGCVHEDKDRRALWARVGQDREPTSTLITLIAVPGPQPAAKRSGSNLPAFQSHDSFQPCVRHWKDIEITRTSMEPEG